MMILLLLLIQLLLLLLLLMMMMMMRRRRRRRGRRKRRRGLRRRQKVLIFIFSFSGGLSNSDSPGDGCVFVLCDTTVYASDPDQKLPYSRPFPRPYHSGLARKIFHITLCNNILFLPKYWLAWVGGVCKSESCHKCFNNSEMRRGVVVNGSWV
jgi:hypothetical protein